MVKLPKVGSNAIVPDHVGAGAQQRQAFWMMECGRDFTLLNP